MMAATSALLLEVTLTYYYRPFGSLNISRVEMKTQDLDAQEIKTWPVQQGTSYLNLK